MSFSYDECKEWGFACASNNVWNGLSLEESGHAWGCPVHHDNAFHVSCRSNESWTEFSFVLSSCGRRAIFCRGFFLHVIWKFEGLTLMRIQEDRGWFINHQSMMTTEVDEPNFMILNKRSSAERIPETSPNQNYPSITIESVSVLLGYVATPSTRRHICYNICFLSLSLWLNCARANVNIKHLSSQIMKSFQSFLIYNQPPWTYQRNHFLVTWADTSTKQP